MVPEGTMKAVEGEVIPAVLLDGGLRTLWYQHMAALTPTEVIIVGIAWARPETYQLAIMLAPRERSPPWYSKPGLRLGGLPNRANGRK